jgi:hypothetical protein
MVPLSLTALPSAPTDITITLPIPVPHTATTARNVLTGESSLEPVPGTTTEAFTVATADMDTGVDTPTEAAKATTAAANGIAEVRVTAVGTVLEDTAATVNAAEKDSVATAADSTAAGDSTAVVAAAAADTGRVGKVIEVEQNPISCFGKGWDFWLNGFDMPQPSLSQREYGGTFRTPSQLRGSVQLLS